MKIHCYWDEQQKEHAISITFYPNKNSNYVRTFTDSDIVRILDAIGQNDAIKTVVIVRD